MEIVQVDLNCESNRTGKAIQGVWCLYLVSVQGVWCLYLEFNCQG